MKILKRKDIFFVLSIAIISTFVIDMTTKINTSNVQQVEQSQKITNLEKQMEEINKGQKDFISKSNKLIENLEDYQLGNQEILDNLRKDVNSINNLLGKPAGNF